MEQRILLVDDETGILDMLETILNKEGFRSIERAETGQRALQLVEEFEPQLIVLDVMLPDMSGLELCMELRKKTEAPVLF